MLQKTKQCDPVDVAVGARVRMVRTSKSMSQETLGKGMGITFQQIQKYEKGTNRMGASRLVQIARVLSVSPAYLLADFIPEGETIATMENALRSENEALRQKMSEIRKLSA